MIVMLGVIGDLIVHQLDHMGVGSKCTAAKNTSTTDTDLFLRGKPPWSIPDGVYSCEEVI
jgi:hypothetical protein